MRNIPPFTIITVKIYFKNLLSKSTTKIKSAAKISCHDCASCRKHPAIKPAAAAIQVYSANTGFTYTVFKSQDIEKRVYTEEIKVSLG